MKVRLAHKNEYLDLEVVPESIRTMRKQAFSKFSRSDFSFVYLNLEGDLVELDEDYKLLRAVEETRPFQETVVVLLEEPTSCKFYTSNPQVPDLPSELQLGQSVGISPQERLLKTYASPDIIYEDSGDAIASSLGNSFDMQVSQQEPQPFKATIDGPFYEEWVILNTGSQKWRGVVLVLVEGNLEWTSSPIPGAEPGEKVRVKVEVRAPPVVGWVSLKWRLKSPNEQLFGETLETQREVVMDKKESLVDIQDLQDLMNMGFEKEVAKQALISSEGNLEVAANRLLELH